MSPAPTPADEGTMRRLKKLLALAMDSAAAPGEAENAMRMAQNLMRKHGVTDGAIASSEIDEFKYQSSKAKSPPPWEAKLLAQLSRAFGSRCYWDPGRGPKGYREKGYWHVLAHKPQLEMIQYAFDVLRRQLIASRSKYVATLPSYLTRPEKAREGDRFGLAFIEALSAKISTYSDQDAAITKALSERVAEVCGGNKIKQRPIGWSAEAANAGAAAGAQANLPRGTGGEVRLKIGG